MATLTEPLMSLTETVTQLRDQVGIVVVVHTMPAGYGVDPCVWCDLTPPVPAVVCLSHTLTPDACLGCAPHAARTAIDQAPSAGAAELITADVHDIKDPTVLSEDTDPERGVIVEDSDGERFRVEVVGVEVFVINDKTNRCLARFDMSEASGRAAALAIGSAFHEAVLAS